MMVDWCKEVQFSTELPPSVKNGLSGLAGYPTDQGNTVEYTTHEFSESDVLFQKNACARTSDMGLVIKQWGSAFDAFDNFGFAGYNEDEDGEESEDDDKEIGGWSQNSYEAKNRVAGPVYYKVTIPDDGGAVDGCDELKRSLGSGLDLKGLLQNGDQRMQIYDEQNGGVLFNGLGEYNEFLRETYHGEWSEAGMLAQMAEFVPTIANGYDMCDLGTPQYFYDKYVKGSGGMPSNEHDDGLMNGEKVCEGHGYDESKCLALGCCEFGDGQCWSSVGPGLCRRRHLEGEHDDSHHHHGEPVGMEAYPLYAVTEKLMLEVAAPVGTTTPTSSSVNQNAMSMCSRTHLAIHGENNYDFAAPGPDGTNDGTDIDMCLDFNLYADGVAQSCDDASDPAYFVDKHCGQHDPTRSPVAISADQLGAKFAQCQVCALDVIRKCMFVKKVTSRYAFAPDERCKGSLSPPLDATDGSILLEQDYESAAQDDPAIYESRLCGDGTGNHKPFCKDNQYLEHVVTGNCKHNHAAAAPAGGLMSPFGECACICNHNPYCRGFQYRNEAVTDGKKTMCKEEDLVDGKCHLCMFDQVQS